MAPTKARRRRLPAPAPAPSRRRMNPGPAQFNESEARLSGRAPHSRHGHARQPYARVQGRRSSVPQGARPRKRLEWFREMLRVIPTHKGTDHLQGDIKRRIKELSEELERPHKGELAAARR